MTHSSPQSPREGSFVKSLDPTPTRNPLLSQWRRGFIDIFRCLWTADPHWVPKTLRPWPALTGPKSLWGFVTGDRTTKILNISVNISTWLLRRSSLIGHVQWAVKMKSALKLKLSFYFPVEDMPHKVHADYILTLDWSGHHKLAIKT